MEAVIYGSVRSISGEAATLHIYCLMLLFHSLPKCVHGSLGRQGNVLLFKISLEINYHEMKEGIFIILA